MESRVSPLRGAGVPYIIIERLIRTRARVNSKSRLSLARTRLRDAPTWGRRKNCIAAGSRGNQINFNANLPASYRSQSFAFNDVISLANSHGNFASCARNERKKIGRGARTTVLIAPDSIELRRFIGDFLYISVLRYTFCDSLKHRSASVVRRFQILQTEMLWISFN